MTAPRATPDMVRAIALALPEPDEREHMGSAAFRVRGKIFAQPNDAHGTVLVKLALDEQAELIREFPRQCSVPEHWGRFGWTSISLAAIPKTRMTGLIEASWHRIAPKLLRSSAHAASGTAGGDAVPPSMKRRIGR